MAKSSLEPLSKVSKYQVLKSKWAGLVGFVRKPFVLFSTGVVVSLGILLYGGANYFVYHKLSFILSSRLSKILERDVKVGLIENLSINSIRIGNLSISATKNSGDYIDIQNATITVDFFTFLIKQTLDVNIFVNNPNFYVSQDKKEKWIALPELKLQEELNIPIKIKTNFYLNNANVFILPNNFKKIAKLNVNGKFSYTYKSNNNQKINYFVNVGLLGSEIDIKGLTDIKSWKTRTKIVVNRLELDKSISKVILSTIFSIILLPGINPSIFFLFFPNVKGSILGSIFTNLAASSLATNSSPISSTRPNSFA